MRTIPHGDIDIEYPRWRGGILDNRRTASVSCPRCGHVASLSQHDISHEGVVTPSLVCPFSGCDFHDEITLDGWTSTPEARP